MRDQLDLVVLGGGVTGLAAALAARCPVLERETRPGGICSSYYLRRGSAQRLSAAEAGADAWRFEHGGGHWIFGGHPDVLALVESLAPCERMQRRSGIWFPDENRLVDYPVQHHLHQLGPVRAQAALEELLAGRQDGVRTMAEWLEGQFGPTLNELFFAPFHEAYTAGLWRQVAPQDGYKTPLDLDAVRRGAREVPAAAGYNTTFLYPREGLDALVGRLAAQVDLRTGHDVVRIDVANREIALADGRRVGYRRLLSTLPLTHMLALCGLCATQPNAPHTSVLVLNIGASRGPRHPAEHWLYVPRSRSGFHRVGFYDNVCEHFLPSSLRGRGTATSVYVERSFPGGERPDPTTVAKYRDAVVRELQDWGFIGEVDVADATWVDVAYTWRQPGSTWVEEALAVLRAQGIRMAGRYARWSFQGIADSLRDGLLAGHALRIDAGGAPAATGDRTIRPSPAGAPS